jgi:rRNA maturation protein Nop10
MKTIAQLTTAEMVAEYNTLTGKSIKKFSSRAAGESQLAKARAEASTTAPKKETKVTEKKPYSLDDGCPNCGTKFDQTFAGQENTPAGERIFCHECSTEYFQNGRIYKNAAKSTLRSEAIKKSWVEKTTAEGRARRDKVAVEGVGTFRSVCEAFKKLNLPMNRHIKFRMAVKRDGNGVFETGDKKYHFKLVEAK